MLQRDFSIKKTCPPHGLAQPLHHPSPPLRCGRASAPACAEPKQRRGSGSVSRVCLLAPSRHDDVRHRTRLPRALSGTTSGASSGQSGWPPSPRCRRTPCVPLPVRLGSVGWTPSLAGRPSLTPGERKALPNDGSITHRRWHHVTPACKNYGCPVSLH